MTRRWREEQSSGRHRREPSGARGARLLASATFRTLDAGWSDPIVRSRLLEAIKGCERLVGRTGPREAPSAWPRAELWGTPETYDLNAAWEGMREGTRLADHKRAGGLNGFEVKRVDEAIAWPARYLGADRFAKELAALNLWLWCVATRESWEQFCVSLTGHKSTANRRRDRAISIICDGLKKDGVKP